jgi:hypothetical protein
MSRVGLFISGLVVCGSVGMVGLDSKEKEIRSTYNRKMNNAEAAEGFLRPISLIIPPLAANVLLCKHVL